MRPYVNEKKCPAQKELCKTIPACSNEAISYVADETALMGGRIVFDYDNCDECGLCADECCGHAIEMR